MTTIEDLTQAPKVGQKAVILFWAPWHDDSAPGGTMDGVLRTLAGATATTSHDDDSSILFARVQAESCPHLSKQYQVTAVPTFVLLDEKGNVFEKIEGNEDVSNVTLAVQRLVAAPGSDDMAPEKNPHEDALTKRLDRLIRSSPVMLFMKGTPTAPKCGFSRQTVALLQDSDIHFGSFDILSDDAVRQGLKQHSNWPTYPQLYVNGTLVGGLDILKEMAEDEGSSLKEQLGLSESMMQQQQQPEESLNDRLNKLVRRHKVMLFMKGLPSAPRCGFSRQICDILNEEGVSFDAYNILEDEEVRQGLKAFSDWPTYPQLYVDGNLIGGLDIVKEMKEDGSLKEALLSG